MRGGQLYEGLGRGFTAAFEFAGSVFLFVGGGAWLDAKFHTRPWLLVVGAVIGFVGGFYRLYAYALNMPTREKVPPS